MSSKKRELKIFVLLGIFLGITTLLWVTILKISFSRNSSIIFYLDIESEDLYIYFVLDVFQVCHNCIQLIEIVLKILIGAFVLLLLIFGEFVLKIFVLAMFILWILESDILVLKMLIPKVFVLRILCLEVLN